VLYGTVEYGTGSLLEYYQAKRATARISTVELRNVRKAMINGAKKTKNRVACEKVTRHGIRCNTQGAPGNKNQGICLLFYSPTVLRNSLNTKGGEQIGSYRCRCRSAQGREGGRERE